MSIPYSSTFSTFSQRPGKGRKGASEGRSTPKYGTLRVLLPRHLGAPALSSPILLCAANPSSALRAPSPNGRRETLLLKNCTPPFMVGFMSTCHREVCPAPNLPPNHTRRWQTVAISVFVGLRLRSARLLRKGGELRCNLAERSRSLFHLSDHLLPDLRPSAPSVPAGLASKPIGTILHSQSPISALRFEV